MKTLQVPFCFYPDPIGGTEVYVQSLSQHLQTNGVEVVVAAPADKDAAYIHDGLLVRRFAINPEVGDICNLYGEGDTAAATAFGRVLDDEQPDLVHLHAFTRAASVRLVHMAKRRCLPVVFTYHTPTVSCQRGTLLRWGREVCDGTLDVRPCAGCTLHGLGLNRFGSEMLGRLPPHIGHFLGDWRLSGGIWTGLRMAELVQRRHAAFRALMAEVDHIVALCGWTSDLLQRNGVPLAKITLSRHGLPQMGNQIGEVEQAQSISTPLRIAYLGRLDPTKGVDILIRALRLLPDILIRLDVYGIAQSGTSGYIRRLHELINGDPRITMLPPVPSEEIVTLLHGYDLLAVPSQCLETGPLVVLEAFAAGVPVVGSRLGGIAELVIDGVDGLLVEPGSIEAWRQAISDLVEGQELLGQLRAGVRLPRQMEEVAEEMQALYCTLLRGWNTNKVDLMREEQAHASA